MYAREGVELERSTLADVPGQELLDAVDRVVGDAGQHIAEIGFDCEIVPSLVDIAGSHGTARYATWTC
jgi:hypothetical protein